MKAHLKRELSNQPEDPCSNALFICESISVHTETKEIQSALEWVFYDGTCRYCTATAKWFEPAFRRRGIGVAPLQAEWSLKRLKLGLDQALEEMRFQDSTGRIFGGADAAVQLARRIWWCLPVYWLSFIPGAMPVLRRGYSRLAAWRSCTSFGRCRIQHRSSSSDSLGDWVPLLLLPVVVALAGWHWANWVFMWTMAFAIFFGCKWLTLRRAVRSQGRADLWLQLGYLVAWPGMDARSFLVHGEGRIAAQIKAERPESPMLGWLGAGACLCFGVALILDAARNAGISPDSVVGWLGMIGVVLVLHFGVFKVLSLLWELKAIRAEPVMRAPMLSKSLTEFWGSRWNSAFNNLVHQLAFAPMARAVGTTPALLFVFLISGLIHELVISLPARGGFGLPTLYFLVQGIGIALERSRWGRRAGLGRGALGRLFTFTFIGGPLFWLFHPLFVSRVIVPMLNAIGPI